MRRRLLPLQIARRAHRGRPSLRRDGPSPGSSRRDDSPPSSLPASPTLAHLGRAKHLAEHLLTKLGVDHRRTRSCFAAVARNGRRACSLRREAAGEVLRKDRLAQRNRAREARFDEGGVDGCGVRSWRRTSEWWEGGQGSEASRFRGADAAADGVGRGCKVGAGEESTGAGARLARLGIRRSLAVASSPSLALSAPALPQPLSRVPDHTIRYDMAVSIENDLGNLVVLVGVAFLLAKDATLGNGGWSRRGAAGLRRVARAMKGATIGDVEDAEVLRDEGEKSRAAALDGLVEFVLSRGKGLRKEQGVSSEQHENAAHYLTLQTAFLEKRKMWL